MGMKGSLIFIFFFKIFFKLKKKRKNSFYLSYLKVFNFKIEPLSKKRSGFKETYFRDNSIIKKKVLIFFLIVTSMLNKGFRVFRKKLTPQTVRLFLKFT